VTSLRARASDIVSRVLAPEMAALRRQLDAQYQQSLRLRVGLGALMAREIAGKASSCEQAQYSAFSQFGEDGIIEFLIQHCDIAPQRFIEIGVETYEEANTRFLAEHRLWQGLIVDQNPDIERDLARTNLNWRAQVRAVSSFVTRENIRALVAPFVGDDGLGLLSVDIDGVDYWVLDQLLDLTPAMIIVEYNSLFGPTAPVSVPYDAAFDRSRPEYRQVYYGAGLAAFQHLLAGRGYVLVACSSGGNNAFFVRSDCLGTVAAQSAGEAFQARRFVEHKDLDGALTGIVQRERQLDDIRDLPLVDVTTGLSVTVADIL
jgi:hypothetical protein